MANSKDNKSNPKNEPGLFDNGTVEHDVDTNISLSLDPIDANDVADERVLSNDNVEIKPNEKMTLESNEQAQAQTVHQIQSNNTNSMQIESSSFQGIEDALKEIIKDRKRSRRMSRLYRFVIAGIVAFFIYSMFAASNLSTTPLKPHTALVNLKGLILEDGDINAASTLRSIRKAYENKFSKGIVLYINSPGGSPVQSQEIYDGINRLKAEYPDKPLYAVIGDIGASGGYYIAAAADTIYSAPASIVGSIGVRMDSFGVTGLIEKAGIERRSYTAGENKALLDPFLPENEEHKEHIQKMLDGVHQQFINAVMQSRESKLKGDRLELFSGLIWNGEQAKEVGLIDDFRYVQDVADKDIGESSIVDYTEEKDVLTRLTQQVSLSALMNKLMTENHTVLR